MSRDPYLYARSTVLRNKLGLRDPRLLDVAERQLASMRAEEGVPSGDFDLEHLKTIHRHLFQDVFDWAGEIRQVEISKGGEQFMFRQYIGNGMADIHRRIVAADYFTGLDTNEFAIGAGTIIGDVNYVHPFREGNGRTQLLYLQQLARRAGHDLDLRQIAGEAWIEASRQANRTDYTLMQKIIAAAVR